MGHITIARVKNVKEKRSLIDRLSKIRLDNLRFKVEGFELMASKLSREGPEYSIVEKFEPLWLKDCYLNNSFYRGRNFLAEPLIAY